MKNPMVEFDEDIICHIHWLDDSCHDPIGGCDESMFMTRSKWTDGSDDLREPLVAQRHAPRSLQPTGKGSLPR